MHLQPNTPRPKATLQCGHCGQPFQRYASELRKRPGAAVYCSRSCSDAAHRRPARSGVYVITHMPTGRIYVGSAQHITKRWENHRSKLHRGYHENAALQAAYNRDGGHTVDYLILELTPMLTEREQAWMDRFRQEGRVLFNIQPNAGTSRGYQLSSEHRAKISAANRGHAVLPEHRAKISAKAMGNRRGVANLEAYRAPRRTVTPEQAAAIRTRIDGGERLKDIALDTGLPAYRIQQIKSGRIYRP